MDFSSKVQSVKRVSRAEAKADYYLITLAKLLKS